MNKTATFIFIVFFGIVAFFSIYNYDITTVNVPFRGVYQVSKIGLILFSIISGALLVLIMVAFRDTKRFISNYQNVKLQRKEERLAGLYSKAINSILASNREEAREILEAILREDPEHVEAHMRMGDIHASLRQHEKAADYYNRALSGSGGKNVEALLRLEEQMEALSKWDRAITYAEKILELDPDSLSAFEGKRKILEKLDRWSDLVEVQKAILKLEHLPDRAAEEARLSGYRYEYARQSLEASEAERAGKLFRMVLKYEREFIPAYLGEAEVLLGDAQTEEAIEFLDRGYAQTGSVILLARLEDMLINLGEPDRIIKLYQGALDRSPNDPVLKFLLGKLYCRLEMIDDALETLRGFESAENFPSVYGLLGDLYMRRERYENAAAAFKKAVDMQPSKLFYCCSSCGHLSAEWAGRCPGCGKWNTYAFNLYGRNRL
ncbi:MAG: tetratricopeptide repeat protein [Nitrospiraceae bacterium]|nr:tetratricopeptide repeat protein [Nitrospiraceae bacterium]